MQNFPWLVCVNLIFFGTGTFLVRMLAISFPSVCWSLSPWKGIYSYAASVPSWGGGGRVCHTVMGPSGAVVVCTHLCSLRWQWQLMPNPRAHLGSALWAESTSLEKEDPRVAPPLSSCTSQQWWLASLMGPGFFLYFLVYGAPHSSSLRLFPCSQPQCSPQVWPLESKPQQSAPIHPSGGASQDGQSQTVALPMCAGHCLLCPL